MNALDNLLDSIAPERTLQETAARADYALNTFPNPITFISDFHSFKVYMTRLFCHLESAILHMRTPRPMNLEFDWSRCVDVLNQEYGREGWKAAFEMARTGNEQGLYGVMKAMAHRMAANYAEREIAARIGRYWNALSTDEMIATARDYIARYGHLLPSELTEGSAARILANFPKVLEQHPRLLQKLRGVARGY